VTPARTFVRHRVGHVDDFSEDQFRTFVLDGRQIGVVRTHADFYAVRNRCPHQGADICAGRVIGTMRGSTPLRYEYDDGSRIVICPWHRWEFSLATGKSVGPVTRKRLVTYAVDVDDDGSVFVTIKGDRADEPV
jgi:nitrite reductase (NADH) small subunit